MSTFKPNDFKVVLTPENWNESFIPQVVSMQAEAKSELRAIGSFYPQLIPVATQWEYELVVRADRNDLNLGDYLILSYGDEGGKAVSQRVFFHSYELTMQGRYFVLSMYGLEKPAFGVIMPKLHKLRFELGDGTFVQMLMTENELLTFDKQAYIDRIYRKGV